MVGKTFRVSRTLPKIFFVPVMLVSRDAVIWLRHARSPPSDPSAGSESGLDNRRCTASENLLVDTGFTREGDYARAWRMAQHTGEFIIFQLEANEGVLEMPHRNATLDVDATNRQRQSSIRRYHRVLTAELKGDLPQSQSCMDLITSGVCTQSGP